MTKDEALHALRKELAGSIEYPDGPGGGSVLRHDCGRLLEALAALETLVLLVGLGDKVCVTVCTPEHAVTSEGFLAGPTLRDVAGQVARRMGWVCA